MEVIFMNDQIIQLVKEIFENTIKLKAIEPSYTWRNLLGDFGEYFSIKKYDLIKAPSNSKDFDATTKDGATVQIKSFNTGTNIKYKESNVDLLLVIQIFDNAECETIYFDEFKKIKPHAKSLALAIGM